MLQCESADRQTAVVMDNEVLAENAESKNGIKPLAQYMSDSLYNEGVEATVYGYHGLGINSSAQAIHKLRAQADNYDRNGHQFTPYRASDYRRAFTPETKQAPPTKLENQKTSG